ncbi:MAG: Na/Pi cotransporter family protein, partial [bacterium]|nr:Na/Pi cotransporter family protein [bacterium]
MIAIDDVDGITGETVNEEERSKRARIKKIKTGFRCGGLVVLLALLVWSSLSGAVFKSIAFSSVGGLGIFLFGMQIMSHGLQKLAGKRLKQFLETITSNPVSAVMVGAGVTAIIQSSSATTVMVIGFVNSGFMTLAQAIGVILGANIGTTITAQLIAFKISAYALPAAGVGFFMSLFSKDRKWRETGQVLLGFGLLFLGLSIMKGALTPLKESGAVKDVFMMFRNNPSLAVIAGAVMTMLLQSSSATIGLTMGMAGSGLIGFEIAVPFILGENIGTTITALLACIGTNVSAKRAALSHALFNIIGVVYVFIMLKLFCRLVDVVTPGVANDPATIERHIANSHTLFNVVNTIIFLPFIKVFTRLTRKVIPGDEPVSQDPRWLDKRLLHTPFMAISATIKELHRMANLGRTMLKDTFTALFKDDEESLAAVFENEQAVDNLEHEITHYLVLIAEKDLS